MSTYVSTADGIGLFTVRRVRALSGLSQLRLLATALVVFLLIDYVRLTLTAPLPFGETALVTAMDVVAYAAILLAPWRPRLAFGVAAIPLGASLFWQSTSLELLLLLTVPALGLAKIDRRFALVASGAVVAYVAARGLLAPEGGATVALVLGLAAVVGLSLGWVGLVLRERRERAERSEAQLATENARIRADERRTLSRELHDGVTHQLSTASVQVMGARSVTDPAALHRVLSTIDHATAEALTELRLLARVLRDDPTTAASGTEIRELSQHLPPTQAAAAAELALVEAGFEVDSSVPARADQLGMTVQRTLSRIIAEATGNVIRHALPRTRCTLRIVVGDQQVTLLVVSARNPEDDEPTLGWGLRGLRERIALTGGTFKAGPRAGDWIVEVGLPRG